MALSGSTVFFKRINPGSAGQGLVLDDGLITC